MSVTTAVPNLDHVFAKWEKRGPQSGVNYKFNPGGQPRGQRQGDRVDTAKLIADGKQRWRDKFGSIIQPLKHRKTRERSRIQMVSADSVKSNTIAQFKSAPTIFPEQFITSRPFMGCCCTCMPNSKKDLMMFNTQTSGIKNLLDVAHEMRLGGWLTRKFPIEAYAWRTKTKHQYSDYSRAVLSSQRVVDVIQQERLTLTSKASSSEKSLEKSAKQIIKVMKTDISNWMTKFTGWFLHYFFGRLLKGIYIHNGQIQMIKSASERGLPVLYLPLHKSHLDYIIITFILWNNEVKNPYIAAGDNLNIPFFKWLIKGLGGFFIRRKLDNGKKRDNVYRAVLQSYMEELLRNGEGLEFFMEGGRSRTGKACLPKGGLMSVVVDTLNRGVVEDAYVVPISISYEKLLDGNFNSEQMGIPKRGESFLGAVRAIWQVLSGHYGSVRVDFAQPFSLKEYIQSNQPSSPGTGIGSPDSCSPPLSPTLSPTGSSPFLRSSGSNLFMGGEIIPDVHRRVIKKLGEHIVYCCVQSSAVMCTNILSFLFLTKHRQGTTISQLIKDYAWLQEEILNRKRDIGFSPASETEEVVHYAKALLGPHIVETRNSDKEDEAFICPVTNIPHVFELSYYSNQVISVFLLESILVNSVIHLSNISLSRVNSSSQREHILISREEVLDVAEQLCNLLKYEFLFVPSCMSLTEVLPDALEQLVTSEVVKVQDTDQFDAYHNTFDKQWATRLSDSLSWAEDEEEEVCYGSEQLLRVNLDRVDIVEKMKFLHATLAPYFESYLVTAHHVNLIAEKEMPEDDFLKKLHAHAKDRAEKGVASYGESAALETLKNAVKAFQDVKIIDVYYAGNLRMVELHDHFEVKGKLKNYINLLESLRD